MPSTQFETIHPFPHDNGMAGRADSALVVEAIAPQRDEWF